MTLLTPVEEEGEDTGGTDARDGDPDSGSDGDIDVEAADDATADGNGEVGDDDAVRPVDVAEAE